MGQYIDPVSAPPTPTRHQVTAPLHCCTLLTQGPPDDTVTLCHVMSRYMSRYVTLHVTLVPGRACCSAGVPSQTGPSLLPPSPGPPVCLYCTLYTVHTTVLYTVHPPHRTWPVERLLVTPGEVTRGVEEDGSTSVRVQVQVWCSHCVPAQLCTAAWQHSVGHHRRGWRGEGWAGLGWAGVGWLCKKL